MSWLDLSGCTGPCKESLKPIQTVYSEYTLEERHIAFPDKALSKHLKNENYRYDETGLMVNDIRN